VRHSVTGALILVLIFLSPRVRGEAPSLATQVHTIFQAKCVECHAADLPRPKGKFGYVLDLARVAANPKMIVPGKPAKSELYQMLVHNEMPDPKGNSPPLTLAEKEIVKAWIEAGSPAYVTPETPTIVPPLTFRQRLVRCLGQFHPPTTHFPIALIIVALPAELMWMLTRRDSWKYIVRFCVILGAAGAVVATMLGWCDAAFSNYRGASAQLLEWHRWFGTATAVWAVILAMLLEFARKNGSPLRWRYYFRVALAIGVVLVNVAGYLGASLIYGFHHFTW
jgi:uncharacterized membrane protein